MVIKDGSSWILIFILLFLASCLNKEEAKETEEQTFRITDDAGRTYIVPTKGQQLVGLSPNITEYLFEICPDSLIVGKSPYCNYPREKVKDLPVLSSYPLNAEQLMGFDADLYLFKRDFYGPPTINELTDLGIPLFAMAFDSLGDIFRHYTTVGRLCNCQERADSLKTSLQKRVEDIRRRASSYPSKTVVVIIQADPLIVMGPASFYQSYLDQVNAKNAVTITDNEFPTLSIETFIASDPEVILGMSKEQFRAMFSGRFDPNVLSAYRTGQIYQIDADLQTRPSPRLDLALEELLEKIYGNERIEAE